MASIFLTKIHEIIKSIGPGMFPNEEKYILMHVSMEIGETL